MDILTIVHITSYAIAVLLLVSLPVRMALFSKGLGSVLLPLTKTKTNLYILTISLAIVMLTVLHFRDFSIFVASVLHGTALLALEMGVREFLHRIKTGLYEKALVVDGQKILKDEIVALPTLEYETEVDNTLSIVTEKRGTKIVFFATKKERESVVQIIKDWQK